MSSGLIGTLLPGGVRPTCLRKALTAVRPPRSIHIPLYPPQGPNNERRVGCRTCGAAPQVNRPGSCGGSRSWKREPCHKHPSGKRYALDILVASTIARIPTNDTTLLRIPRSFRPRQEVAAPPGVYSPRAQAPPNELASQERGLVLTRFGGHLRSGHPPSPATGVRGLAVRFAGTNAPGMKWRQAPHCLLRSHEQPFVDRRIASRLQGC